MSYLFSDTERAARRLQVLADVFALSSRPFLQEVVSTAPEVAIDLGCGPGYTTRLIADVTQCVRAVGLDSSEHFLSLAMSNAPARLSFVRHDVTQIPLPTGPGDLIFCRMLLTHLRDPLAVIERWGTQLRPQGCLLLEEVEWIQTEQPHFAQYLVSVPSSGSSKDFVPAAPRGRVYTRKTNRSSVFALGIVAALLRQQANELYIGPQLAQQQAADGLRCRLNRVYRLPVSTKQAATIFSMNIPSWKNHPFIQQQYGHLIDQLERDLQALVDHATGEGEIVWGMRQLAYERR